MNDNTKATMIAAGRFFGPTIATYAGVAAALMLGLIGAGCSTNRDMATNYQPDPPKECQEIIDGTDSTSGERLFEVHPYPSKTTSTGQVNVWLAKEGTARKDEHAKAKVCAEHALRTAGVMADAPKPKSFKAAPAAPAHTVTVHPKEPPKQKGLFDDPPPG